MAVGESSLPKLHAVPGVRLGVTSAGIKTPGRLDLVVMELAADATVAGVFTTNAFCAAPVQIAKQHLAILPPSYFVINTGNANAGTGEQGLADCVACCDKLADITGVARERILPFSTGVIGEPLPVDKISEALPAAVDALGANGWADAAEGIMTTDTRPKAASTQFEHQGHTITVTGIAKGSGMIKPNMATMLAYIATDAPVEQQCLQGMLKAAIDRSFNRITVDGDTSTNDACMLIATGNAGVEAVCNSNDALYQPLLTAMTQICIELAQSLVRDGEGATKFVSVIVDGGNTEQECLQIAYTVAESPLVKTALFAGDPNWGRLLAAIGRAGIEELDVSRITIKLNNVLIVDNGCRASSYTEQQGVAAMANENIDIMIDLQRGEQQATVWTSDLSYDYVRINAEYRS